jgi:hypothetical protein
MVPAGRWPTRLINRRLKVIKQGENIDINTITIEQPKPWHDKPNR